MNGESHDYMYFYKRLNLIGLKSSGFQGVANFGNGLLAFDKNDLSNQKQGAKAQIAEVLLMDKNSVKSLRFPLSEGTWIYDNPSDAYIPCVIGGYGSSECKVGEILKGFFFLPQKDIKEGRLPQIGEVNMKVVGKLAAQTGILDLGIRTDSLDYKIPASILFQKTAGNPLYIILPSEKYPLLWYKSWSNTFMYFSMNTKNLSLIHISEPTRPY